MNAVRVLGLKGAVSELYSRLTSRKLPMFGALEPLISGKRGLEIGGPSKIFEAENLIPIYPLPVLLDGCNYAENTAWGRSSASYIYPHGKDEGRQYINEATDLRDMPDDAFDFLLASHVIEHVANPIKALKEWRRVLKQEGVLVIVVPHKEGTFDHRRPVTKFNHIVSDYDQNTRELDITHFNEIQSLHDLRRDPRAGTPEQFRRRSEANASNRTLHHHVFDTDLAVRLVDHCRMEILTVDVSLPYHIAILARKTAGELPPDNSTFFGAEAPFRRKSPFRSDRSTETL